MRVQSGIRERGFTLIEIAVVLLIVGLMTVGLLDGYVAIRTNKGIADTNKNHEAILTALRTFLLHNNRLPCPALGNLPPGDANYGVEAPTPGTCTGTVDLFDVTVVPAAVREHYLAGVIPWATLGLQGDERFDGFSRRFSYAVLDSATQGFVHRQGISNGFPWTAQQFMIFDGLGNPIPFRSLPPDDDDGPIAIIVSHGSNGFGAFNADGGVGVASPSADELENTDGDITVVIAQYRSDDANPFDDVIRAYTEAKLIAPLVEAGSMMTREAETMARMERIENELVAFAIGDNLDPDGAMTPAGCSIVIRDLNYCNLGEPGFGLPSCELCAGNLRTVRRGLPPIPPIAAAGVQILISVALPNLPAVDQFDAWGTEFRYTPFGNVNDAPAPAGLAGQAGIWSGASAIFGPPATAFQIKSFGPDGVENIVACGGDDICTTRTFDDLVGQLSGTGVAVD